MTTFPVESAPSHSLAMRLLFTSRDSKNNPTIHPHRPGKENGNENILVDVPYLLEGYLHAISKLTHTDDGVLYRTVSRLQLFALGDLIGQMDLQQCDEPLGQLLFSVKGNGEAVIIGVQGHNKLVLAVCPTVDVEASLYGYGSERKK